MSIRRRAAESAKGYLHKKPQPDFGQAQQCFRECALNPVQPLGGQHDASGIWRLLP
jgi:hypothetical protein